MKPLPVIPRELARLDAEQAIDHYLAEAGRDAAFGFIDALEAACAQIGANPSGGTPRWGQELNLPGLRSRKLKRYPYLVFFMAREDHVDVWRILHAQRDIPSWLQDSEED
ncbi:MAG: type II toxin-antitoxin system RelE/ParE family toxin [Sandarakinorhabdus sp.]|nr:type II toxin-antitoxin system RelE/ParE family toxin [Sandarakinorhabdus sp.]